MNNFANYEYETQQCECCDDGTARLSMEKMKFLYGAGSDAETLTAEVPVWICDSCGERYTADGAEEAQHDAICDHLGRLRASEIVAMRQRAGLTQKEFAELFDYGRASVARWENRSQMQSKSCDKSLRDWQSKWLADQASTQERTAPRFRTDVRHREPAARAFLLQAA